MINNNQSMIINCTRDQIIQLFEESRNSNAAGDAVWILTSAFIIFTMQSGFGLLEAGTVSQKNEANIMVKNAIDVIFGGFGYWVCGFAFSFGDTSPLANEFTGIGHFFTDVPDENFGDVYAKYFFQLSFATTATTIVSGAMAERTNLKAYIVFSFLNMLSYVFPAHWVWDSNGFFYKLDVVDIAGCGPVHLVGGICALVSTLFLRPRTGTFDKSKKTNISSMASPTNVVLGTFMLWWGWLGFNCGSTFGISGGKWKLASKAAVTTVNASVGSGIWVIIYLYLLTKKYNRKLDIGSFTSAILGGLVSITASCAVVKPWEAIIIGFIGGIITSYGSDILLYLKIDDPVCCIPVHCFCGIWGLIATGIFAEMDNLEGFSKHNGVAKGGEWKFLGYQVLCAVAIAVWSAVTCFLELIFVRCLLPIRITLQEEIKGADFVEHGIVYDKTQTPGHGAFGSIRRSKCSLCHNRMELMDNRFTGKSLSPILNKEIEIDVTSDDVITTPELNDEESITGVPEDIKDKQENDVTTSSFLNHGYSVSSLFSTEEKNEEKTASLRHTASFTCIVNNNNMTKL